MLTSPETLPRVLPLNKNGGFVRYGGCDRNIGCRRYGRIRRFGRIGRLVL